MESNDAEEYDTDLTPEPVCPHCGRVLLYAWELFKEPSPDTATAVCDYCEKEFTVTRIFGASYTTAKAEV